MQALGFTATSNNEARQKEKLQAAKNAKEVGRGSVVHCAAVSVIGRTLARNLVRITTKTAQST